MSGSLTFVRAGCCAAVRFRVQSLFSRAEREDTPSSPATTSYHSPFVLHPIHLPPAFSSPRLNPVACLAPPSTGRRSLPTPAPQPGPGLRSSSLHSSTAPRQRAQQVQSSSSAGLVHFPSHRTASPLPPLPNHQPRDSCHRTASMASNGVRADFSIPTVLAAVSTMQSTDTTKKKAATDFLAKFQKSVRQRQALPPSALRPPQLPLRSPIS